MVERSGGIRAITFDLDDTLWDVWAVVAVAEQRLHEWLDTHYPRIPQRYSTLDLRALCDTVRQQRPDIAHDRSALRREALARAAVAVGYAEFAVEPAFEVFFRARNEVVFFEEVMPVLERLAGRYALAALSNGNADIRLVGLAHLFHFGLNAADVGRPKPEPEMFREAIARLGCQAHEIVHVGDEPEHDVLGAQQLGMRTVWVNRNGAAWPGGPAPDAEVRTLEELESVLESW